MRVRDKVVVVTGAASGIGRELARAFAGPEGARHVVCADVDGAGAEAVANEIGGSAQAVDVGREADIVRLIETTEAEHGPIDLFCSNAGIAEGKGIDEPDEMWDRIWRINTMSHVWGCSAPGAAHGGPGRRVPLQHGFGGGPPDADRLRDLCRDQARRGGAGGVAVHHPPPRRHPRHRALPAGRAHQHDRPELGQSQCRQRASVDGLLEPDVVAQVCVDAIAEERFFAMPHEVVKEYMRRKVADPDRWLGGMRRLQERYMED